MTPKEAYALAQKKRSGLTVVECVDLGSEYGFVFVDWDIKTDGPMNVEKAYKLFNITGWTIVDKKTGVVGELSIVAYLDKYPMGAPPLTKIKMV